MITHSLEAANSLLRATVSAGGSVFGWHRESLASLAGRLAALPLAQRGLSPASTLALEAVCTRVVSDLGGSGLLGRFASVADRPGLPRALARTFHELRMSGPTWTASALGECDPDLARLYDAYARALEHFGLTDRSGVFSEAITQGHDKAHPMLGVPTLFYDVAVSSELEADLVARLALRSNECFAIAPAGDATSLEYLRRAFRDAEPLDDGEPTSPNALHRLQTQLFSDAVESGDLGEEVTILSAPGESRECVEIARHILLEAERGVPFDRIGILVRSPELYRSHLVEALRRARIPAYFARGTTRPERAGRALLALLACASDGLSASRFAEYLSLGVVPKLDPIGEPPAPYDRAERFALPDDEARYGVANDGDALDDTDEASVDDASTSNVDGDPGPVVAGTLRAPRRWEQLLVDAAVVGGRSRWERRLAGLERALTLELAECEADDDPRRAAIVDQLEGLRAFCSFALPLLDDLAALPNPAEWRQWLDALSALTTRAIADPSPVLRVLAELEPMASVGPVDLTEVRLVLEQRLGELVVRPRGASSGKVFVASIDDARGLVFDVVFVPGLAEKIFPKKVSEDPLLLDSVRQRLSPDLAATNERIGAERCALHMAVGAARERVVLTFPRFETDKARPRVPSFYALEVLRAAEGRLPSFDGLTQRSAKVASARMGWPAPQSARVAIDAAEYDLAVLETLLFGNVEESKGAAHYLLTVNAHLARALRFRARRWLKKWGDNDGLISASDGFQATFAKHAPAARAYSATALEKYAACPYRFYLSAIMRLAPRESPEPIEDLNARVRGTLIHEVLRSLLTELRHADQLPIRPDRISEARVRLDSVVDAVSERFREELSPAIERVWRDGIEEIRADLRQWLELEAQAPTWTPAHFELAFGFHRPDADPSSQADLVELDCGLQLRGSIDLVERRADKLRTTDFKTGKTPGRATLVIGAGRMLQPVLYALALEKLFPENQVEGGRAYYCTPRGDFHSIEVPLDNRARESAALVVDTVRDAIAGAFLPPAPDNDECERCDFRSICGPYEGRRSRRKDPAQLKPLIDLRNRP